jgi:glycosidase
MLWSDIAYEKESHDPNGRCRASTRRPDRRLFAFFKRAIALRREHAVFRRGRFAWLKTGSDRLLGFRRWDDGADVVVLFNTGDRSLRYRMPRASVDLWKRGTRVGAGWVEIEPGGWRILAAAD